MFTDMFFTYTMVAFRKVFTKSIEGCIQRIFLSDGFIIAEQIEDAKIGFLRIVEHHFSLFQPPVALSATGGTGSANYWEMA